MKNNNRYLFAVVIIIIILLHHIFFYAGHFGCDDMYYAKFAYEWSAGNIAFSDDHYAYRWGIIAPTALFYRLLGVNDTSSSIPPLLITIATGVLLLYVTRHKNTLTACLALTIFALNRWTLYYSDKIMPDGLVALCIMAAATVLYRYRYELNIQQDPNYQYQPKDNALYALVFSTCLFVGFLAKETVWLSVPIWLWIFVSDVLLRRYRAFWTNAFLFGGLTLAIYFCLIAYKTGNPFYRFYAIQHNSYFMPQCSFDRLPWSALLERITYGFPLILVLHGLAISLVFMIPTYRRQGLTQIVRVSHAQAFISTVALLSLASAWFMTTSLQHYMPMCPDPRHYLFIVPLAAWAAAPILNDFICHKTDRFYFIAATWLLVLISFIMQYDIVYTVYLPLAIWTTLVGLVKLSPYTDKKSNNNVHTSTITKHTTLDKPTNKANSTSKLVLTSTVYTNIAFISLLTVLLLHPITAKIFAGSTNRYYNMQKEIICNFFKNKPQPITVITNEVEQRFAEYYYGFKTGTHRYITYKDVKNGVSIDPQTEVYILMEGMTQWLSGQGWEDYPLYARQPPPSFEKVYDNQDNITVYKVHNIGDLIP